MFDFGNITWEVVWPVIKKILNIGINIAPIFTLIMVFFLSKKDPKKDLYINKNGIVVKSSVDKKELTAQKFVECMSEVIVYIEEAKENYMDDIFGIKRRIFKQSKDFAESSINSVKNEIIERYKVAYMAKYRGNGSKAPSEGISNGNLTTIQLKENTDDGQPKKLNPCDSFCGGHCNSGLYYFDSKITKDFLPIINRVDEIIEENHLINRLDREFEEEVSVVSTQLSSELKNRVLSYPVPIDNNIAKGILDELVPTLKETIADSLRRSRTLSKAKREWIAEEQTKYLNSRNAQLSRIITIMSQKDLEVILKSSSNTSTILIGEKAYQPNEQ